MPSIWTLQRPVWIVSGMKELGPISSCSIQGTSWSWWEPFGRPGSFLLMEFFLSWVGTWDKGPSMISWGVWWKVSFVPSLSFLFL